MKDNKQVKRLNDQKSFFKCTAGNALIFFAIMAPAICACMFISFNYNETLSNRARISEATNEASLAIAALNNKNVDSTAREENKRIALSYINYFLNQEISDALSANANISIDFDSRNDIQEYHVSYTQKFGSLFGKEREGSGDDWGTLLYNSSNVTNNTESYGNARKVSSDGTGVAIAFIADFSGSATCKYNDPSCNKYSEVNYNQLRVDYMKEVIVDIVDRYKGVQDYDFALIPYDIGVPTPPDVPPHTLSGDAYNVYNCSVLYKMKPPYDTVDYNFWANKNMATNISFFGDRPDFDRDGNMIYYYLDYYFYLFYSKIIEPSMSRNMCRERNQNNNPFQNGESRYACNENAADYPLKQANKDKIKNQYNSVAKLYNSMYSGSNANVHYSFANTETVNVIGTIDALFSDMDNNIITFNRPVTPTGDFSPFYGMCQSPLYNLGVISENMVGKSNGRMYEIASGKLKDKYNRDRNFKTGPVLIPLPLDKYSLRDKIADWKPGGGTDTITALLRAVPEIAGGAYDDKILIIITDGKDDKGADVLRDDFLNNNVCQTITTGLKTTAQNAAIHYIKIDPNARNLTSPAQYEQVYGLWYTKCMDRDERYLHEAHDYQSLIKAITKIIETETGQFINKND
ncbi:TadE/TadG family type IV pilus assembly protein [Gilliamella sp. Nev3-1]|uniref:TadE/TadG family type IV pilus assembly protein n=1 Tax=Gilliamella sp. Nev3-1 TaxID=3120250 RepID=UPI00080EDD4C|nr:TadE/TadG family type IV pilus assembly protein [Gilliamella apicola]OCG61313.1 hypothetical protein A9G40_01055 [Gilliamella apicola]